MLNWKETTWGKFAISDLIKEGMLYIGDGYRAKNEELRSVGLPFARAGNIDDGFDFDGADCFPLESLGRVGNKVSLPGDVVFTSKGTVGRFLFVSEHTPRFVYAPQLCFWRSLDQQFIIPCFLYYWMLSREFFVQYKGVSGQTDMAEYVSLTDQRRMHITLPPFPEQKAIAAVLSSFDDKIELLRRQNKTMEAIAQTIFKEWFVNFKIKGHKLKIKKETGLPEGWRVGRLGDELSVAIGGDWGNETKIYSDDVQAYCLRGTDLDSLKSSGHSAQVPIRWIKKNSLEKRAITENDILIGGSGLGPIGKTVYCHENIKRLYHLPITYSNFCKRLTAKNKYYALYYEYQISKLYNQGALERFFIGTSIPNLDMNGLLEEMVVIPDGKIIEEFAKILEFRYAKMINPQIQILSKLRDLLLPKLMRGEIRVNIE